METRRQQGKRAQASPTIILRTPGEVFFKGEGVSETSPQNSRADMQFFQFAELFAVDLKQHFN